MSKGDGFLSDFLSFRARLAGIVSRLVPAYEVEDILQETYVRACKFHDETVNQSPRPLMVRIARNLAIDHLKRAESQHSSSLEAFLQENPEQWGNPCDDPSRQLTSEQEFFRFCEAVRSLPLQCRRAFVLKKVYGHSQRYIAEKLNLSENTVEKHIAKGMRHCIHHLAQLSEQQMDEAEQTINPVFTRRERR